MNKKLINLFVGVALLFGMVASYAQEYPNRPIKLIVPVSAGGTTDVVARTFAQLSSQRLGKPIVIDNRGGANGTLGAVQMLSTNPSGYTLTLIPIGVFRYPFITGTAYDPAKDFTYISTFAGYNYYIAVNASSPFKSLADLVAFAKGGGVVTYGSPGVYSSQHIAGAQLGQRVGGEWTHVPYKGGADLVTALLGDQVKIIISASAILPYAQSGKIRVLAALGPKRTEEMPNVPTLTELGYPIVHTSSLGIAGPKGMPKQVVDRLEKVFKDVYADPAFQSSLQRDGMTPIYMDHATYTKFALDTLASEKISLKGMGISTTK